MGSGWPSFQATFDVLMGAAAGAFFAPIIGAASVSFEKRRVLAIALVSTGMGMAPMTIAPLAGWLVTIFGWRQASRAWASAPGCCCRLSCPTSIGSMMAGLAAVAIAAVFPKGWVRPVPGRQAA